jgi:DNA topoisomerase VI subunit B
MHELNRKTFTSSRLAEFASEAELVRQTGHPSNLWAWVIVKEAIDNALDACEEAGIAPLVEVEITDDAIIIGDYGPGIAPETVAAIRRSRMPSTTTSNARPSPPSSPISQTSLATRNAREFAPSLM